jgi:hypothetical protein
MHFADELRFSISVVSVLAPGLVLAPGDALRLPVAGLVGRVPEAGHVQGLELGPAAESASLQILLLARWGVP